MAARSGVIDTSAVKGIAGLHAEVLSNDPVVAPAHEVVQDSDMIADHSMPPVHADAAPDHGADTAIHATEDASAGDAGHVHADLAYADSDLAYADADHANADHAYADQGIADLDHAYADHAYADAAVPDTVFADHSILPAYDGTPHSLGADAGKGDDGHDAAAWWWAGGAALGAGGIGYWLGHEHNDDSSTSSAAPDVHVVVESTGAYIDANGDGVRATDGTDDVVATFGHGGTADLDANHVTVHFNDMPFEAINLTGFGEDDKIEFHMEALMGNNTSGNAIFDTNASYLSDMEISSSSGAVTWVAYFVPNNTGWASIDLHQCNSSTTTYDMSGNQIASAYYFDFGYNSGNEHAIAYWTDDNNALNNNHYVMPNFTGTTEVNNLLSVVLPNMNNNSEGSVVDFIWPSAASVIA